MHDENYIAVQGWMVKRLSLTGNELLLYALVYGFSQDEKNEFYGSLSYIEGWLGITRPTVIELIKKLIKKELIIKTSESHYKVVKKFNYPSKETLLPTSKETLPNKDNTKYNNKSIKESSGVPEEEQSSVKQDDLGIADKTSHSYKGMNTEDRGEIEEPTYEEDCDGIPRSLIVKKKRITPSPTTEEARQVNALIGKFNHDRLGDWIYKDQKQRGAIKFLMKRMSYEKLNRTIDYALSLTGLDYAPQINTPMDLKYKISNLISYWQKANTNGAIDIGEKKPKIKATDINELLKLNS